MKFTKHTNTPKNILLLSIFIFGSFQFYKLYISEINESFNDPFSYLLLVFFIWIKIIFLSLKTGYGLNVVYTSILFCHFLYIDKKFGNNGNEHRLFEFLFSVMCLLIAIIICLTEIQGY